MEILALKLMLTESDVRFLLANNPRPDEVPVKELQIDFTPAGVVVRGKYPMPMLFTVPFETLWELKVRERLLEVRLAQLKVVGFPVGPLRGLIMNALSKLAYQQGIRQEGEALLVEVDRLLEMKKIPVRLNLTGVHCAPGHLILEAGMPGT